MLVIFMPKALIQGVKEFILQINSHFNLKKNGKKKIILEKNNICIIVHLYKHQSLQLSQCFFTKNRNAT